MIKTGVFGGAFNPVHKGHVRLAEEAVKQLKLKKLLIIPTYCSPHKHTDLAPFDDRAQMCSDAFGHVAGAQVCDIERRLGGTSYTINTLRALRELYPNEQFYLLIGGDMLFSFDKWFRYEAILNEAKVCAVARGGDSYADMLEYANELGKIRVLPTQALDISSTQVRELAARGEDISALVLPQTAEYISQHGLYREQGGADI